MKNFTLGTFTTLFVLSLSVGFAMAAPMTPELAAKQENYRKQNAQRITPEKRQQAAEALKAERVRIHQAKKRTQQPTAAPAETK